MDVDVKRIYEDLKVKTKLELRALLVALKDTDEYQNLYDLWKKYTKSGATKKDQKNFLEALATTINDYEPLEEEEEYHSPTAEELEKMAKKGKKDIENVKSGKKVESEEESEEEESDSESERESEEEESERKKKEEKEERKKKEEKEERKKKEEKEEKERKKKEEKEEKERKKKEKEEEESKKKEEKKKVKSKKEESDEDKSSDEEERISNIYESKMLQGYKKDDINKAIEKLKKNLNVDDIKKLKIIKKILDETKKIKEEKGFKNYKESPSTKNGYKAGQKGIDKAIKLFIYHYLHDCKKISPSKEAPSPKKVSPKKASPKKVSPKKVSPKKASPKKVSPKKASPKKVSPKKVSPKKASPKKASPKKVSPKKLPAGWKMFMDEDNEPYYVKYEGKKMIKGSSTYDFPVEEEKEPAYSPDFIKGHSEAYLLRILKQKQNKIESVKDYDNMKASNLSDVIKHLSSRNIDVSNIPKPSEKNKKEVIKSLLNELKKHLKEETEEDHLKGLLKNKLFKDDVSLDYLKALYKGKKCDPSHPCDDGEECDLENGLCVPETLEEYYDDIERMKYKGKGFTGKKETLEKLVPVVPVVSRQSRVKELPKDLPKPDEEEIDLDLELENLNDLDELKKALVECLMPVNKDSVRSKTK